MKFKLLPAGKFVMGSRTCGDWLDVNGAPPHVVRLTRPFHLGAYQVTQAQYERVMGTNPSDFPDPERPVEMVLWEEAVEFCRKLSAIPKERAAGRVYRLPTEAEWEVCLPGR